MSATQGKNDLPKRNAGLKHLGRAWDFYRETLGSPKYFAAPMVNQSELPYRMLVRKYNTDVAFTPMFHARIFSESKKSYKVCVQISGNKVQQTVSTVSHTMLAL